MMDGSCGGRFFFFFFSSRTSSLRQVARAFQQQPTYRPWGLSWSSSWLSLFFFVTWFPCRVPVPSVVVAERRCISRLVDHGRSNPMATLLRDTTPSSSLSTKRNFSQRCSTARINSWLLLLLLLLSSLLVGKDRCCRTTRTRSRIVGVAVAKVVVGGTIVDVVVVVVVVGG